MTGSGELTILGTGNIGRAVAEGLVESGLYEPRQLTLTRRRVEHLDDLSARGFRVTADNRAAVQDAGIVVVAVEPQQLDGLLVEIGGMLVPERQVLVSVVAGVWIDDLRHLVPDDLAIVRAMPNTAIALGRSMTCLAAGDRDVAAIGRVRPLFDALGRTLVIPEELMVPATALCACGIAYFLRVIRAASQGGIEIGFHPDEALALAAQTALGAASLVLAEGGHPERQIDHVTTPRGCTISGLNQMEHAGLSSAMIRGIVTSAEKAASLYRKRV
ncbi:MAG: pyrroline-5-carboxylate reductase [Candidatus Eiseniibacteriota bacterium]|jgi:pyrroline-5-carboxylate reductase